MTIQMKDILLMHQLCKACKEDFTSHSFNLACNTLEGGHLFYTKIASASQYDDTTGIVKHCTNYLSHINPEKWTWIIDFAGFGLKHTLGLNTGIQLSKLVNTFGRLHQLVIININPFVEQMLKMIKLTLNKEYHHCIYIVHSNAELKNIIEKWTILDLKKETLLSYIS